MPKKKPETFTIRLPEDISQILDNEFRPLVEKQARARQKNYDTPEARAERERIIRREKIRVLKCAVEETIYALYDAGRSLSYIVFDGLEIKEECSRRIDRLRVQELLKEATKLAETLED